MNSWLTKIPIDPSTPAGIDMFVAPGLYKFGQRQAELLPEDLQIALWVWDTKHWGIAKKLAWK